MNLLFGLAIAAVPALCVYVFYRLLPKKLWRAAPEPVRKWKEPAALVVAVLTFLIMFATNFSAYGPRMTLDSAASAPEPIRQEVESGSDLTEFEDRTGGALDRLREAPVRADVSDAAEQ